MTHFTVGCYPLGDYRIAAKDRSALYLTLLATLNSGRLELPDDKVLLRELRGLERRRGPSGRDRVDHPPGAHDDVANAVAGLSEELFGRARGLTPADLYEMRSPIGDELGLTGYQARYLKTQDNGPSESKRESLSSPLGS